MTEHVDLILEKIHDYETETSPVIQKIYSALFNELEKLEDN